MARRQQAPVRALSLAEQTSLEQVARARSEPAERVIRAKLLLAVADGAPFTVAARSVGRCLGVAVRRLVACFNAAGSAALTPRPGGGPLRQYGPAERERILREFRRPPDREQNGTATWSL